MGTWRQIIWGAWWLKVCMRRVNRYNFLHRTSPSNKLVRQVSMEGHHHQFNSKESWIWSAVKGEILFSENSSIVEQFSVIQLNCETTQCETAVKGTSQGSSGEVALVLQLELQCYDFSWGTVSKGNNVCSIEAEVKLAYTNTKKERLILVPD